MGFADQPHEMCLTLVCKAPGEVLRRVRLRGMYCWQQEVLAGRQIRPVRQCFRLSRDLLCFISVEINLGALHKIGALARQDYRFCIQNEESFNLVGVP